MLNIILFGDLHFAHHFVPKRDGSDILFCWLPAIFYLDGKKDLANSPAAPSDEKEKYLSKS